MWSLCRSDMAAFDLTMTIHSSGVLRQRASHVFQTNARWLIGFLDIRKPWPACIDLKRNLKSVSYGTGEGETRWKSADFWMLQILKIGDCNYISFLHRTTSGVKPGCYSKHLSPDIHSRYKIQLCLNLVSLFHESVVTSCKMILDPLVSKKSELRT